MYLIGLVFIIYFPSKTKLCKYCCCTIWVPSLWLLSCKEVTDEINLFIQYNRFHSFIYLSRNIQYVLDASQTPISSVSSYSSFDNQRASEHPLFRSSVACWDGSKTNILAGNMELNCKYHYRLAICALEQIIVEFWQENQTNQLVVHGFV